MRGTVNICLFSIAYWISGHSLDILAYFQGFFNDFLLHLLLCVVKQNVVHVIMLNSTELQ